jgi:hypothetical protein
MVKKKKKKEKEVTIIELREVNLIDEINSMMIDMIVVNISKIKGIKKKIIKIFIKVGITAEEIT